MYCGDQLWQLKMTEEVFTFNAKYIYLVTSATSPSFVYLNEYKFLYRTINFL